MAKVSVEGPFPKRIDDYVLYRLNDQIIIRAISGFTSKALKNSPKYALSRQNASEFGRVSSTCKALRIALNGYLPKKNNLLVVNSLTKKMRQVLPYDTTSVRGERTLAKALSHLEGVTQLIGYPFNPDAHAIYEFTLTNDRVLFSTATLLFPDGATDVSCTLVALEFDFDLKTHAVSESAACFYSSASVPPQLDLPVPFVERTSGVLLTILVVAFYVRVDSAYVPVEDDRCTVVLVVGCEI